MGSAARRIVGILFEECSEIGNKPIKIQLSLATAYRCQSGYMRYATMKTIFRRILDATTDVGI